MLTLRVFSSSLVLLLLMGCASKDARTVQVICQETPAYSSRWGSESQSSVSLGNTFQVTDVSFSGRLRLTGAQGDTGTTRFLDANCVAPFPLQGQARWIQTPLPSPVKSEESVSRSTAPGWQMGDEVEALLVNESWVPPGQTALLSKGALLGFVPTASLGEKAPTPEQYTQVLSALLSGATFDQALALTRRAAAALPQQVPFQRLLGHLVTLEGSKPVKPPKPLPRLAALPDLYPDPSRSLSDKDATASDPPTVYSMAVGLRVRESADSSSTVLATLNVNQPLELLDLSGEEWARVNFSPGHQLSMSETGAALEFVDAPSITGYVSRRFLGRQPWEAEQLLTQGQEALKAGRSAEAIVLLHRALEAEPDQGLEASNRAYVGLIQASFEGGRFEDLFQSIADRKRARPAREARAHPSSPLLLMGCHGERARAKIVDLSDAANVWAGLSDAAGQMKEPHVCVGGVDPREPARPEVYCPDGECPRPAGFAEAVERYEQTLKPEYERWHDKVASYFDSTPYLVFSPADLGSPVPDKQLVFYEIPMKEQPSEGGPYTVRLDADNARVALLQVPRDTDWKQLLVWLALPDYLNAEFGLAFVDTEDQVRDWLKKRDVMLELRRFRVPEGKRMGGPEPEPPFPVYRLTSLPASDDAYWYAQE